MAAGSLQSIRQNVIRWRDTTAVKKPHRIVSRRPHRLCWKSPEGQRADRSAVNGTDDQVRVAVIKRGRLYRRETSESELRAEQVVGG
jgi:hypothetical protein